MRPFLFFALLFISSLSFANPKKLVVLGDSLSEGYGVAKEAAYPAVLEKKLHEAGKKEWTVINAGVSGSTTASAISRMKWIFKSKPDVVLLALGANDGLRGLKVEESEKHLGEAIEYAQSQKVRVILGGLYMPPNYGKDYSDKFKKMYESLAKKYKVTFIPFILDKVAGNPKYNLADGIHPNEEGHKIVAENIFAVLKGEL
ncbi:arylesterase [Bdellovibrio sp. NC01]|uniref:arylesterase n=1 Tax=Bdellovibrio sp. NC01 TaxID=2220073 RepID=UPI00115B0EAE|nr:arylesterase [Bdellovibrio sp. NC01]QDK36428.1 arylesterase [Bdellovibrio sp. NC01]